MEILKKTQNSEIGCLSNSISNRDRFFADSINAQSGSNSYYKTIQTQDGLISTPVYLVNNQYMTNEEAHQFKKNTPENQLLQSNAININPLILNQVFYSEKSQFPEFGNPQTTLFNSPENIPKKLIKYT